MDIKTPFLIICISLITAGCKKDADIDPLTNVVFAKSGIIRVECSSCSVTYSVLDDNYTINVINSKDIVFDYVSDFKLKTSITASTKQNIRLAVFDSYGRQISNELNTYDPGQDQMDTFSIEID